MASETTTFDAAITERERVLRILRASEAELRARGVVRLRLFGSMARGGAGPESDSIWLPRSTGGATGSP